MVYLKRVTHPLPVTILVTQLLDFSLNITTPNRITSHRMEDDYLGDGDDLYADLIFGVSTAESQNNVIPSSTAQKLSIDDTVGSQVVQPGVSHNLPDDDAFSGKDIKNAYQSAKEVK